MIDMIAKYEHDKHYTQLVDWLAHKNMPKPDPTFFSDCGYCIDGNAIGFLLKTNSRQCYLDHVAANPHVSREKRDLALNTLFHVIETKAKEEGFGLIIALSEIPSMKERLLDHSYRAYRDFTPFFKFLRGNSNGISS